MNNVDSNESIFFNTDTAYKCPQIRAYQTTGYICIAIFSHQCFWQLHKYANIHMYKQIHSVSLCSLNTQAAANWKQSVTWVADITFQFAGQPIPAGRVDSDCSVWPTATYNSCERSDCIRPRQPHTLPVCFQPDILNMHPLLVLYR